MKAHELARELGISQKELVNFLQQRRLTRNTAAPLAPGAIDAARTAFKPTTVTTKIETNGDRRVALPPSLSVKDLADKLGVSAVEVIKKLMASKILANINQVIDSLTGSRAEVHALMLAAIVPGDDPLLGQLLVHAIGVGVVLVDLVDRDDDRHLRRPCVLDGLDRLRHHAVIGRHDQDHQVSDLRAAGTHCGEGLVTRRVDENHRMAVRRLDLVGADSLRDAAGLAGGDLGLADRVEDGCLSVVDVTQDRDDGGPRLELGRVLFGK